MKNDEIDIKYYKASSFVTSSYKKNISILKSINLQPGDIFFDIGAHRGEELNYLKDKGCIVHSFECNPYHFKNLKKIYKNYENIILNENVVTNSSESEVICYFKNSPGKGGSMSSESSKNNIDLKDSILVKNVKLSDYIKNNNVENIKVLKIDAEGSEYKIIEDIIDNELISNIQIVLFEDHESKINSKEWLEHKIRVLEKMKKFPKKFQIWH